MTTFALVHGAYHGGWCWERLVPELERRGFGAVAPDLPCDDAGAGIGDYAEVVRAAIAGAQDVVLVGHSLGSLTIPVVAARQPVQHMVFLCSVPTGPGPAIAEGLEGMVTPEFASAPRFHDANGTEMMANPAARQLFFHDCDEVDAWWAVGHLRPQASRPLTEPVPLPAWPDVPQSVVLAADDRVVRWAWAVPAARARLCGADPHVLPGSHSPFLSRPAALADALAAIVAAPAASP
ncbi:MAG TPA: alpha/beta fold hydrolase [Acidimicrobiales bacterium]|nr:alpha/beta fold hydrolase [Acidimicrobiales bacterium]